MIINNLHMISHMVAIWNSGGSTPVKFSPLLSWSGSLPFVSVLVDIFKHAGTWVSSQVRQLHRTLLEGMHWVLACFEFENVPKMASLLALGSRFAHSGGSQMQEDFRPPPIDAFPKPVYWAQVCCQSALWPASDWI